MWVIDNCCIYADYQRTLICYNSTLCKSYNCQCNLPLYVYWETLKLKYLLSIRSHITLTLGFTCLPTDCRAEFILQWSNSPTRINVDALKGIDLFCLNDSLAILSFVYHKSCPTATIFGLN